ncbi:hypothetical protein Nepgr_027674 [Nepenthes gracilis]|uniref:GTP cyclohydrolase 1 n=1 Tax=Nepenthes gracilis TaxID=150966 RepID=A0AAD3Y3S7_NEPGR|nr:hypothetical protein Nepgr_027674 [Nepenthes gracilis]
MGALDEGHCDSELENAIKLGFIQLDVEEEPQIAEIEDAVKILLQELGEDINREGLRKTPLRVAKAFREGTRGYRQKVKDIVQGALFPEHGLHNGVGHAGGAGGLVVVRDLDLFSYCESCLLPFQVKCHVGYVSSGQRVVGLSKLSRVADVFAKRLQDPQRLADEVCSALDHTIKPAGVAVILHCQHLLVLDPSILRWNKTVVSSGSGVFGNEEADIWNDLFTLLQLGGSSMDKPAKKSSDHWCLSLASATNRMPSNLANANPAAANAVVSIIRALGEDPSRKELIGTPTRFLKWITRFKTPSLDMSLNGFVCTQLERIKSNGEEARSVNKIHSELNLPFLSQCEHHLLPFHGVVHVGYFCAEGVTPVGVQLLQSVINFFGFRLQVQERLTRQIAETVAPCLGGDVVVVVEAKHTCMMSRGIEKLGSSTATMAVLGRFLTEAGARSSFLQTIPSADTSNSYR